MVRLMKSGAADALFLHPLVEQTAPVAWAFVLPLTLYCFLGITVRRDVRSHPSLARPSFEHGGMALISTGLLLLLSLWLLHPTPAHFAALQSFGMRFPVIGDPLLNALVGVILLVPTLPLPLLTLPPSLLLRHRTSMLLGLLSIIGFLLFPVLEALYFGVTGPPLVAAVQWLLGWLPGSPPADLSRWQVGYGDFSATVGYACTELSSVTLFLGLLCIALLSLRRTQSISPFRVVVTMLLGIVLLWLLNVLRIAAIVIIGSYHRTFALTLFHSGIGLILFLLFFAVFIRLSLPFVRKKE